LFENGGGGFWFWRPGPGTKKNRLKTLGDLSSGASGRRRDGVDDVAGLAQAEISVTDEVDGLESRGGAGAFEDDQRQSMRGDECRR